MRKRSPARLDFEVDKLTNSIENILTGEVFETEIVRLTSDDILSLTENEWLFDWKRELDEGREVYKLRTLKSPTMIQGLISMEARHDHIFIYLIESASFNKGSLKLFRGVAANVVAFACKASFERGFKGYVMFVAKSRLIEHYERSLGAKRLYGTHMFLDTEAATRLIHSYYKDFDVTRL